MLTKAKMVNELRELGLQAGDVVLVHSSYKSLGEVEDGPQTVIDALLEVLTPEGTLIMPTFNFNFNKGEPWDVNNTPSHMGVLTEIARINPQARRVFSPILFLCHSGKAQG